MCKKTILSLAIFSFSLNTVASDLDESDYFTDLPVVLSVTRLAQPLSDTPGAVTVIDREMIRRSGARDIPELLRLVPGFIVSHKEGGPRPFASYHADYDDVSRHLQVFIDERSVYSSLIVGSSNYGAMGIVLDDIERIEVLRGSNSAAYGANAFLGVVNITTRHASDTHGGMLSGSVGESQLRDGVARYGWGNDRASFRLSAASRNDQGYENLFDDLQLNQAHFRGDLRPSDQDELSLLAGFVKYRWGVNETLTSGRDETRKNGYASLNWKRQLSADNQISIRAAYDEEAYDDFDIRLPLEGTSKRTEIEAQNTQTLNAQWRIVWGGQYRHEQVISQDAFGAVPDQSFNVTRLFGNAEWKPHPQWLINIGGLWEDNSIIGDNTAPRLMINYHLDPNQTLRVGATSAFKLPTLFELKSNWGFTRGTPYIQASGKAQPERIDSTEIGYLGEFRDHNVTVDIRVFEERISDLLRLERPCSGCPNDFVNKDPNTQRGWETQLRWHPTPTTQILANYSKLTLDPDASSTAPQDEFRAPQHIATLALFQKLPANWDLSIINYALSEMFWVRKSDMVPSFVQTDVRLARQFRIGETRAEAALMVSAANGEHIEFVIRGYPVMEMERRAMATLKLDF